MRVVFCILMLIAGCQSSPSNERVSLPVQLTKLCFQAPSKANFGEYRDYSGCAILLGDVSREFSSEIYAQGEEYAQGEALDDVYNRMSYEYKKNKLLIELHDIFLSDQRYPDFAVCRFRRNAAHAVVLIFLYSKVGFVNFYIDDMMVSEFSKLDGCALRNGEGYLYDSRAISAVMAFRDERGRAPAQQFCSMPKYSDAMGLDDSHKTALFKKVCEGS